MVKSLVDCYDVALEHLSLVGEDDESDVCLSPEAMAVRQNASKVLNVTPPRDVAEAEIDHRGQPKRRRIDPRRAQQERDEERERNRVRSCFELIGTDRERRRYEAGLCFRCTPRAYVSETGRKKDLGAEYYSATPKEGYRFRGNAPYLYCYHVKMNTESGSLKLDNEKRAQDWDRQYEAIGGVKRRGRG